MSEKKICEFTFDEIKELACLVADKHLGKIAVKTDNGEIVIEGQKSRTVSAETVIQNNNDTTAVQTPCVQTNAVEEVTQVSGNVVKSPIVGTFYASPAPDKAPFVKEGQKVSKGDTIMIIESMKLMNEVTSDFDGVVKEIFVQSGTAVEYDQPIMIIQ